MDQWLAKVNTLKSWQAAIIIAVVGFAVFFTGLATPFMGDDNTQIVNNPVVHSMTNIRLFFEGSTFYNGQGIAPLNGVYYRPLATTVFSLLYTLFGPHPVYFHLFQLSLCIGSAILLYLVFGYTFTTLLSLILSLIFLVHPLNSQVVFAIPSMQDALFFFFGLMALWLLLRFRSVRSLTTVAGCLFLSLLSKESGVLFIAITLTYLFWWDRKRLYPFIGIMAPLAILWLVLKTHAVGLLGMNPNIAPIDSLSLTGRLLTAPSIMLFYLTRFLFPLKLASAYYWVYPTVSFRHVILPLIIDLAVIAGFAYLGFVVHRKLSKAMFYTYLFFSLWLAFGLLIHLQFVPIDFTASETWFYFPMAGLLGMIGIFLEAFQEKIRPSWFLIMVVLVISVLGLRSLARGMDWKNSYTLASRDIISSKEQYNAYNVLATYYYTNRRDYSTAKYYAAKSVALYANGNNNDVLGMTLIELGDYSGAYATLNDGLKRHQFVPFLCNSLARLTVVYGNPSANVQFLRTSLKQFPKDGELWFYYAVQLYRIGDISDAKSAIVVATADSSQVPLSVYDGILNHQPFALQIGPNTVDVN